MYELSSGSKTRHRLFRALVTSCQSRFRNRSRFLPIQGINLKNPSLGGERINGITLGRTNSGRLLSWTNQEKTVKTISTGWLELRLTAPRNIPFPPFFTRGSSILFFRGLAGLAPKDLCAEGRKLESRRLVHFQLRDRLPFGVYTHTRRFPAKRIQCNLGQGWLRKESEGRPTRGCENHRQTNVSGLQRAVRYRQRILSRFVR